MRLKHGSNIEMIERVDVLPQRLFTTKGSTTLLALEDMSRRLEVLVKGRACSLPNERSH
jgi:hypothetical protein